MATQPNVVLSIVIPVYNEAENVSPLLEELVAILNGMQNPWEIVVVDDGSTDATINRLESWTARLSQIRIIPLARNFGQTAALSAGFDHARGDWIITLDGDRQNDPADIPRLYELCRREKLDVLSGWRRNRKDTWLTRRLPSQIANALISLLTGVKLHDYGCTLKVYRRKALEQLDLYGEMHRFIPALLSWSGARIGETVVTHRPRTAGKSKYGIGRTFRVLLDLITVKFLLSYSTKPIQVFGGLALLVFFVGMFSFIAVLYMKLYRHVDMTGNPFLYLVILCLLGSVQLISLGLLGEMLTRTYFTARGQKRYVLRTERDLTPLEPPPVFLEPEVSDDRKPSSGQDRSD